MSVAAGPTAMNNPSRDGSQDGCLAGTCVLIRRGSMAGMDPGPGRFVAEAGAWKSWAGSRGRGGAGPTGLGEIGVSVWCSLLDVSKATEWDFMPFFWICWVRRAETFAGLAAPLRARDQIHAIPVRGLAIPRAGLAGWGQVA